MFDFQSLLQWGVNSQLPDYINERIRASNLLSLVIGSLSFPFFIITIWLFPPLMWFIGSFVIFTFSVVLFNKLGLFKLSRFIISAFLITDYTIYHCSLLQKDTPMLVPLWAAQMVLWLMPLTVFDVREKGKLAGYLIYGVVISGLIPAYKDFFSVPLDVEIIRTGWLGIMFIWATVCAFLAIVYLITNQYLVFLQKNGALLADMMQQNALLSENQEKLNEYIKEVERAHEEEKKRKWMSDGLAMLAEVIRTHTNTNTTTFFDKLVSSITKYIGANQSGIFVAEEQEGKQVLILKACYAYDRKKYIQKKITPGEGLVGQCYLEKEHTYLTNVPDHYVQITSGLGEATPKVLLIAPIKTNDVMEGVLEIASFKALEPHEIEFVLKAGENIASVINTVKINERTQELLEQSQLQGEQMRAQEEEMRQNLEELMATQEEMQRKEIELQTQAELMSLIIDNIPFPVFIKDEKGCYTLVNKAECDIFNVPKSEIIGFSDSKFIKDAAEIQRIQASDKKIVFENVAVHFPEQVLELENGVIKVFKTSKIPFYNKITKQTNILGVSVDLSDTKNVERELKSEIEKLKHLLENATTAG